MHAVAVVIAIAIVTLIIMAFLAIVNQATKALAEGNAGKTFLFGFISIAIVVAFVLIGKQ